MCGKNLVIKVERRKRRPENDDSDDDDDVDDDDILFLEYWSQFAFNLSLFLSDNIVFAFQKTSKPTL